MKFTFMMCLSLIGSLIYTFPAISGENSEQSIQKYNQVLEVTPNDTMIYKKRAQAYLAQARYLEAIADFNRILKLEPHDERSYAERGIAYVGLQQNQQAEADFDRALKLNPQRTEAYIGKAHLAFNTKSYPKALELLNYALLLSQKQSDPEKNNLGHIYYKRGLVYHEMKQYGQAIQDYTQAIQGNLVSKIELYYRRGLAYQALSRYEQALLDFSQVITMQPDYAQAYYQRGNVYQKLKKFAKAESDYTRTIELDPASAAHAYHNRALARGALGNVKGAAEDRALAASMLQK